MYQLQRSKRDVERIFDIPSFTKSSLETLPSPLVSPIETLQKPVESSPYIKENIYKDFFLNYGRNIGESSSKNEYPTYDIKKEEIDSLKKEVSEIKKEKELLEKEVSEIKSQKENVEQELEKEKSKAAAVAAVEEAADAVEEVEEEVEEEPVEEEPVEEAADAVEEVEEEEVEEEEVADAVEEVEEEEAAVEEEEEEEPDEFLEQIEEETPIEIPQDDTEEYPITTYDYGDDSYYIDNTPFLEKIFLFPDGEHPIDLCIYSCVRTGCMPYVLYLTVYDKTKNTLTFPLAESIVITENDSEEDIRNRTMENFKNSIFNIFPPNEIQNPTVKEEPTDVFYPQLFKGLSFSDEKITMVYDATRVHVPVSKDKEYFWVTPYEILVLYQYKNIIIDDSVISFFQNIATSSGFIDKSFYQLKRVSDGSLVPTPYVMFPCSPSSSTSFISYIRGDTSITYENIVETPEEEINLFIPTINHPKYGNFPIFSSLPLDKTKLHIKRCAVFVDIDDMQPTFLNTENPELIDHLYDITQDRQFTSFSFIENNIQYWCIKSPLYFSEIYDDPTSFLPITSFTEFTEEELHRIKGPEGEPEPEAEPLIEDMDDHSNEGSEISNEGSEISNEGNNTSDEEENFSDESDSTWSDTEFENDDYKRGYEAGLKMGYKQKTVEDVLHPTE